MNHARSEWSELLYPNVLLITIDCLRADHAGFMGYDRPTTPNLDRLAAEALLCTNAFATGPRTAESFPGIIASAYALMYGGGYALTEHHITLAEVLNSAGYDTAAFHSNPYLSTNYGYDRGFATFWDSLEKTSGMSRASHRANMLRKINRHSALYRWARRLGTLGQTVGRSQPFVRAGVLNGKVTRWLTSDPSPFFLWLHYMDPHYPYLPEDEHLRLFSGGSLPRWRMASVFSRMLEEPASVRGPERQLLIDLYDAEVRSMDAAIGQLLAHLRERRLYDDLLIVVTADHGEEFGEHGEFSHATWASEVQDGRVQPKLHDELLHVPLLLRFPRGEHAGERLDGLVSLVDVAPTILEVAGLEPPDRWCGQGFLPAMLENGQGRPFVFSEYLVHNRGLKGPVIACRTEAWKYIHEGVFGRHELYDLENDSQEQQNVVELQPDMRDQLALHVGRHQELLEGTDGTAAEITVDDEVADRLRGLGYLA